MWKLTINIEGAIYWHPLFLLRKFRNTHFSNENFEETTHFSNENFEETTHLRRNHIEEIIMFIISPMHYIATRGWLRNE